MLPTVVLVGRPNVGKSTLFNRLTRSRDALVADQPGLTRDRHYGKGRVGERPFLVVDTGGLEPVAKEGIMFEMAKQSRQAVDEADVVMFLVDGRAGCTPQDAIIAEQLRKTGKPVLLLVNKAEGMARAKVTAEFFELGLGEPLPISSAHGDNVTEVVGDRAAEFSAGSRGEIEHEHPPKLAIVGRPNVGKSTLVNAILGEQRVIAFDQPGTTRDSIYIDFERGGKAIHHHRHRRGAQTRQGRRGGGKILRDQNHAGDRRCQRGGAGGGRPRPDHRTGRARRRLRAASGASSGAGGQQMGRAGRTSPRSGQARHRAQAAFFEFRQTAFHFCAARQWHTGRVEIGG